MGRALGEAWAHLSHVPLRAEASDRAECVNEVLAGETVTELELGRGDWVNVRLPDGYEGMDGPSSIEACDGHVAREAHASGRHDNRLAWRLRRVAAPQVPWFESIKESGTWANSALSR